MRLLGTYKRNYLVGKKYGERKKSYGGREGRKWVSEDHNDLPKTTAQEIADEEKVSEPTVKRAEKFTEAVDRLAETVGEDAKNKILSRDINITQKDVGFYR